MADEVVYVWLAEERHGYHYVFSSWDKAFAWLEKEKHDQCFEDEEDQLEKEIEYGVHAAIYWEGELVGRIERQVLDEQAV